MTKPILILGGTGKTGRRIANRLEQAGRAVRAVGRSTTPSFDWDNRAGWSEPLNGVEAVYISYQPDLMMPGAVDAVAAFTQQALDSGVRRIVLLSGRGEEEAQAAEQAVANSGADWTFLRCAWFNQNFSEGQFLDSILAGELALPVGGVGEPFVDADDIAEIAVKALMEDGHSGKTYELTGPRLLSFADAIAAISRAAGRNVAYRTISAADFRAGAAEAGLPPDMLWLLDTLFSRVLDGRNESTTDDIQQVLGRPARDFDDFARDAALSGVWKQ